MTGSGGFEPDAVHGAATTAELLALMRQLKEHAGLTYRGIEERAAAHGDVLARSTLADTLRRTGLPRPEVLAAFVRACGEGERVDDWLAAHHRAAGAATGPTAPPDAPHPPEAPPRRLARRPLLAGLAAVVVLAGGAVLLNATDSARRPAAEPAAGPGPAGGEVRIRPASAPGLCLTEGRDRQNRYSTAVAVQRPCDRAVPPRTLLEELGGGLYRIRWVHPEFGEGCLTVLRGGAASGLLEPRDDCAGATRFRIERAAGADGYRVRTPGDGTFCLGMAAPGADGGGTGPGADGIEAVEQPCTSTAAPEQRFLIDPS
ncbi:XRE family transcriptional regulator [Kitasatospora sp. NPDC054939]